MEKRYGNCVCHNRYSSLNAKGLCPEGARERNNLVAINKGFKEKENECNERSYETGIPIRPIESKKAKINRISENKKHELAVLAEIKKSKIAAQGSKCEMCEKQGEVDLFHIIGVGNKEFAINEDNLLLSCRFCHLIWGANDFEKILKFNNFYDIMNRLKSLDSGKYWKFRHKIEKHVLKKYFDTKDRTDLDRLGIKFISPL